MTMMKSTKWFVMVLLICLLPLQAMGDVPQTINFHGYLTSAAGVPVTNAAQEMTFRLYTAESGGTAIWSETRSVAVVDGIYKVHLGELTAFGLPFDSQYWLGLTVGSDPEMVPRQKLSSVPTALRAEMAETVRDGAITDAKITGPISLAKIDTTGANFLNRSGDTMTGPLILPVDGLQVGLNQLLFSGGNLGVGTVPTQKLDVAGTVKAMAFTGDGSGINALNATNLATGTIPDERLPSNVQKKYGKVAVVAKSGGDFASPLTAMAGLASWCGVPTAENPCMLKIMPGIYDLGTGNLVMQEYVDIEGSGENTTVITSQVSTHDAGVVNGANNAEIRFVTLKNYGATSEATVVGMVNISASPTMTNLSVKVAGGLDSYGVVNNNSSNPTMRYVTANATDATRSNVGIRITNGSSPNMSNVIAFASGGTTSTGVSIGIASPKMTDVSATGSGGTEQNFGVYTNESHATINNVVANASGGASSYGFYNDDTDPTLTNVTATASGGTSNYGVYNWRFSSPTMINVTSKAFGGTTSYGLYNAYNSSPTLNNVVASGESATEGNYGMFNEFKPGTSLITIVDHSTFIGATNSIHNEDGYNLRIGASKLKGGAANSLGTYTCVGVYNGDSYTALNAACQ